MANLNKRAQIIICAHYGDGLVLLRMARDFHADSEADGLVCSSSTPALNLCAARTRYKNCIAELLADAARFWSHNFSVDW